jgi:hypothetical protein
MEFSRKALCFKLIKFMCISCIKAMVSSVLGLSLHEEEKDGVNSKFKPSSSSPFLEDANLISGGIFSNGTPLQKLQ